MEDYFELKPDEGYDFIFGEDALKIFRLFRNSRGGRIRDKWLDFRVEIVSKNLGKNLKAGDFLIGMWGSAFVFRQSVQIVMGTAIVNEGEILSFSSERGEPLYLLNPAICDCLLASVLHLT